MKIELKPFLVPQKTFIALIGAVSGIFAAVFVELFLTIPSAQRYATVNDFVTTFNNSYIGKHRDNVSKFLSLPEIVHLSENKIERRAFNQSMSEHVRSREDVIVSVYVLGGFYRQLYFCSKNNRCNVSYVEDIFKDDVVEFLSWFSYSMRVLTNERGYDDIDTYLNELAGNGTLYN